MKVAAFDVDPAFLKLSYSEHVLQISAERRLQYTDDSVDMIATITPKILSSRPMEAAQLPCLAIGVFRTFYRINPKIVLGYFWIVYCYLSLVLFAFVPKVEI